MIKLVKRNWVESNLGENENDEKQEKMIVCLVNGSI